MTDAEFIAWLKTGAETCVLVEAVANVAGVETTRYLSNTGYRTGPADTPANQYYAPLLQAGGKITERLSLDGSGAAMSFGDIELTNTNRAIDTWLQDVWTNRSVKMWVGDKRWPRSDFRLVFDGITADLGSRARNVLNLRVRDKLQRLNTAVTSTKLGGAGVNADRLLPIVLGEVHNIEPLFTNPATLEYQVHSGATERIIEVRDNGVVVATTNTLATGKFTLTATPTPSGIVTASVQGGKLAGVYVNTVAKLVELLATTYGTDPFTGADLDAASLATFDAAHPQPVGVYLAERENVLALCQQLAASVGAQLVISSTGLLKLVKVALPATGTPTAVTERLMIDEPQIVQRVPVRAAVKIGYCRNWTVQTSLQTGLPEEHKDLYGQEWLTVTKSDAAVAALYKLTQEPQQEDTYLLVKADADAEATRRRDLWKVQRTVYGYPGAPELLLEQLGGYQQVTSSRYGLAATDAQIVGVERDWFGKAVNFEVLA
jgi:hypothetical protein